MIWYRYGLVTQQTRPHYKFFSNQRTMEEAKGQVIYYDQVRWHPGAFLYIIY